MPILPFAASLCAAMRCWLLLFIWGMVMPILWQGHLCGIHRFLLLHSMCCRHLLGSLHCHIQCHLPGKCICCTCLEQPYVVLQFSASPSRELLAGWRIITMSTHLGWSCIQKSLVNPVFGCLSVCRVALLAPTLHQLAGIFA
jgi:hypothetical protein